MSDERQKLINDSSDVMHHDLPSGIAILLRSAIPIFFSRCAWVVMKMTDSALLGHTGTKYLAASSLSDLWTMTTGVFILDRILGVMCSQANGAKKYEMIGIWFQVSMVVVCTAGIVVMISWWCTGPILSLLGQPYELAHYAGIYASVLSLCLPGRILFAELSQVLQSQSILRPSVVAGTSAMIFNLIFGFILVIVLQLGFIVCPAVTVMAEVLQSIIIVGYYIWYKGVASHCWPSTSIFENVTKERFIEYVRLYLPAVLQLGTDFWRMAAVGSFAAALGEVEVVAFNVSYRVMWLALAFVGSLARATSYRVGKCLGSGHPKTACEAVECGLITVCVFSAILSLVTLLFSESVGAIFSNDVLVGEALYNIRFPLSCTVFMMTISFMLEVIPTSVGNTYSVFKSGFIACWFFQIPIVAVLFHQNRTLKSIFTGVAIGYVGICALYIRLILNIDWHAAAVGAQRKAGKEEEDIVIKEMKK